MSDKGAMDLIKDVPLQPAEGYEASFREIQFSYFVKQVASE